LGGDGLVVGHHLVEAQLVADPHHGHHPGAAHVSDDLAHELVELRLVHIPLRIDPIVLVWRRRYGVRARLGLGTRQLSNAGVSDPSRAGRERPFLRYRDQSYAMLGRGNAMGRLRLNMLGGFQARLGSGAVLRLRTRHTQALLAYRAPPRRPAPPRRTPAAALL